MFLLRLQRHQVLMTAALTSPFFACASFRCFQKDLNRKAHHGVPQNSKAHNLPSSGKRPSRPVQSSPERVPTSSPTPIRLSRYTLLRRGASSCSKESGYFDSARRSTRAEYSLLGHSVNTITTAPRYVLVPSLSLSLSLFLKSPTPATKDLRSTLLSRLFRGEKVGRMASSSIFSPSSRIRGGNIK